MIDEFIVSKEDCTGCLSNITFQNQNNFNYAFDVIDVLGTQCPNEIAMVYVDESLSQREFTYEDIMSLTNKTANYFESLHIKKGDRVMLVLKKHYQFWISILALHKIGAIAVPATSQLREDDFSYRFEHGNITAVVCTASGNVPQTIEHANINNSILQTKIIVGGTLEGWHCYDDEYVDFSSKFPRRSDSPSGKDKMLMFFTSGTTGHPKIVTHDYTYPLGHYITAKYWHRVQPGGTHLAIADTGWAKALWSMLYGQWICKATLLVFDYDRFHAKDLLHMIEKYNVTTFCAPPTAYRMLIKEPVEQYDLSSIQCATTAGEPLNPEVHKQFKELTGITIMEGFGQSETTLVIGTLQGTPSKPGSMGKPIPSYPVDIVNANGVACGIDEVGEIVISRDTQEICGLFKGYYNNDIATKEAWHDGVYHTGDLAKKDVDGYYWYVGRTDDIIKSSGYKISPFEIENILIQLPYVVECAVSPVPDEIRGQIIKASIVLTKGISPTDDLKHEIQEYVKIRTAPYKYPRVIAFVEELPKTSSGKIMRNKL